MNKSSKFKTALVAVSGGLAAMPATALELGEIKVHSTLGQPLRASVAYALGPNEAVSDTCVTLQRNMASNDVPSLHRASMIVTDGVIAITGRAIAREPLMTLTLNVRCPYTAQLTREYTLFIDPADVKPTVAALPAPTQANVAAPAARQIPTLVRRRPANITPIADATRYQVQPGDSLSEIVQRIENREVGLWPAVNAIFAANPDAFIDNDPNKIKAGSWISIPDFGTGEMPTIAEAPVAGATETASTPVEPVAASTPYEPADVGSSAVTDEPAVDTALGDLEPGDVILNGDNAFVSTIDDTVVIPDTEIEGPVSTSDSPNVPVAEIRPATPATAPSSTNWFLWLAGSGLAIIAGLLLFGRRLRGQFGSTPIGEAAAPQRRESDTIEVEAIAETDLDIADESPTEENLALDADLIVGTGLQEGTDVDVAQDFGFAATTELDIELPEEMSSGMYESPQTDIIPPLGVDAESILESEVLPEEDDYDMSVIVDATKMPQPEDVTGRDLEAIQIDAGDETLITDDYTLSQEVDYKIVEQDYEDEMTATQALNAEIQKAAEEIAVRMDDEVAGDETAEMPLATVHELDVTAQLPGRDDEELGDDDDTGVNPTVNMEAEDKTVEMGDDKTVEMPKGGKKAG